jgi:hypothetical protein
MTKTQRPVGVEDNWLMPDLSQLMWAAWRQGVHVAWTAAGEVVVGGPDTPAARSAMDALRPYAELLRRTGLLALAEQGVPPMPSLEAAWAYVRCAVERDRAGGRPAFLETLMQAAADGAAADRERGS